MNCKAILATYLKEHGYDGLVSDDRDCGCGGDGLMICDGPCGTCEPAYRGPAPDGGHLYYASKEARDAEAEKP